MQQNDCYLSSGQSELLMLLANLIKERTIKRIYEVSSIGGVPHELREYGVTYSDLLAFAKCDYLAIETHKEVGVDPYTEDRFDMYTILYTFDIAKILNNIGLEFQNPDSQSNKSIIETYLPKEERIGQMASYNGLSEEQWNFLVKMAEALNGEHIKNPSSSSKGFYILPVIENGRITEFKNFTKEFSNAYQNELKISLEAFSKLVVKGFFDKAKGGNYYLAAGRIFDAVDDYLSQKSDSDIKSINAPANSRKLDWDIFMVMPFRDALSGVYESIIIPLSQELSLSIKRGDEGLSASDSIIEEVFSYIKNAKIIIVDCTETDGKPNGNVYYELGYADALDKNNVILISQTNAVDLPFDIRHRRVIHYTDNARGNIKLKEELKKAIQSILD